MLELMVTTVILIVISGAALSLFSNQQPLFNRQQNMAGLNIAIRNAVAQLQLDVVNAGSGTLLGPNISNPPVAVSIINSIPSSPCNTAATFTYGPNCFDQFNVISADPSTPVAHPDNGSFIPNNNSNCVNSTASPMYLVPPAGTSLPAATAYAANFHSGDELMLVVVDTSQFTTVRLNADGTVFTSGANSGVKLSFSVTNGDGSNSAANDPLNLTTNNTNPKLGTQFCSDDWVIRLAPITYWADTSNPSDPKLVRTQGGTVSSPCTAPACSVLAEQIIGFKVGAMIWNNTDDSGTYNFYASNLTTATPNPGYNNQFWLVRSLQISLIGRTTPATDPTYTYRNGFDNGPYQIESVSVVVDPRNLTMNNQ